MNLFTFSDCHEIAPFEKDEKYGLSLDMGDRKYEFQSVYLGERDKWYEVLKNSRKTAKDVKNSFTKRPRNLERLSNVTETEGVSKLKEICEAEKDKIIGDYKDL